MTDEATSIYHPGIILLLNEANGGFRVIPRKGGLRIESSTICLNDLLMSPQLKAYGDVLRFWPAEYETGTLELGKFGHHLPDLNYYGASVEQLFPTLVLPSSLD